jgi:hypothetical protein
LCQNNQKCVDSGAGKWSVHWLFRIHEDCGKTSLEQLSDLPLKAIRELHSPDKRARRGASGVVKEEPKEVDANDPPGTSLEVPDLRGLRDDPGPFPEQHNNNKAKPYVPVDDLKAEIFQSGLLQDSPQRNQAGRSR